MRYRRTRTFNKCFENLPETVQQKAKEKFRLFKSNPHYPYHPSLRIKQLKGHPRIWEGHVTLGCVFTFHIERDPETNERIFVFRKIGSHDIYRNP